MAYEIINNLIILIMMLKKPTYIPPATNEVRQDQNAILCASISSVDSDFENFDISNFDEE